MTSLAATIGPEANLLETSQGSCRQILLPLPVIDRDDLAKLMYVNEHGETPGFKAFAIDGLFDVREAGVAGAPTAAGGEALRRAIEEVRQRVRRPSRRARTSSSSPTATRRPTGHPSPRCC